MNLPALKQHLRVTHDRDDAYIAELAAAALDVIGLHEGRFYGDAQPHTVVLPGSGTRELWLPLPPASVTKVEQARFPGDEPTEIAADAPDGWLVRDGAKLVRKGGHVWLHDHEYTVETVVGWDDGPPPRVQQAVRMLVAHYYTRRAPAADVRGGRLPDDVRAQLVRRVRVS